MHAMVISGIGFAWQISTLDSIISNILLAASALLITIMLQFYIPEKNKYGYIIAIVFSLSILWLLISKFILSISFSHIPGYSSFLSDTLLIREAIGFLIIGCMSLISVLWYTIQDQQEAERRKTEAQKLYKEAELFKLRQQLQPHFLFNSLNSINALIGTHPGQARTMIQQLSDFLRGTLKKDEQQWASLEEELEHLQLYLDIEQLRFGNRLFTILVNKTKKVTYLPAMLLQPIVENAIKFGLYDTTEAVTITINAQLEDDNLCIIISNPFDPKTSNPTKGTGFGLHSIQRRLFILFARQDLLQTSIDNNMFSTIIKIPQHDKGNNYR
jgi:two-component system, LytTR family, sensor kinase